ncbi:MAG: flavodoxin family protein [Dehalococcoidales bacterium]|nr:flavodoxin family protein [Dehalococcoidales bacterium]
MKALVVYDSAYGNTEKIARAIGSAITGDVKTLRAGEVNPSDWALLDLLVVGSPTQGGKATQPVHDFLNKLPESAVKGKNVAVFDTRMTAKWVSIFGYAAGKIADSLKKKGGNLILPPEGFYVTGGKGPLKEGEPERAASWAKKLAEGKK